MVPGGEVTYPGYAEGAAGWAVVETVATGHDKRQLSAAKEGLTVRVSGEADRLERYLGDRGDDYAGCSVDADGTPIAGFTPVYPTVADRPVYQSDMASAGYYSVRYDGSYWKIHAGPTVVATATGAGHQFPWSATYDNGYVVSRDAVASDRNWLVLRNSFRLTIRNLTSNSFAYWLGSAQAASYASGLTDSYVGWVAAGQMVHAPSLLASGYTGVESQLRIKAIFIGQIDLAGIPIPDGDPSLDASQGMSLEHIALMPMPDRGNICVVVDAS